MKVVFNVTNPIGNRVVLLEIKARRRDIPVFKQYEPNQWYRIFLPSFVANGGDGYSMIRDNIQNYTKGDAVDIEVFATYLQKVAPVSTGIDGRITML